VLTQSFYRLLCDAGVRRKGNESTERSVTRSGAGRCEVRIRARCGYTLACNADCDVSLYLYRPQPVRVGTCPAPDWGARGARLFRGQAPFLWLFRLDRVKLLIFRSWPFVRSTQIAVPRPWTSPVRSSLAVERELSFSAIWSGDPVFAGDGGTVD
jgi:hypothetical protein